MVFYYFPNTGYGYIDIVQFVKPGSLSMKTFNGKEEGLYLSPHRFLIVL